MPTEQKLFIKIHIIHNSHINMILFSNLYNSRCSVCAKFLYICCL